MKCVTYGCLLLLSMSFSWPDQTYEALSKLKNMLASPYMKIETIPAPEGNWTYLPDGDGEMKIVVTTSRAKRIKVWRVPTGTQQWEFRKLICDESGDR